MMTFEEFRKANVERSAVAFGEDPAVKGPAHWLIGAVEEVGEIARLVKHHASYGTPLKDMAFEIADAVTYLDLLAASLGIDLAEALREKYNVVSTRIGCDMRL